MRVYCIMTDIRSYSLDSTKEYSTSSAKLTRLAEGDLARQSACAAANVAFDVDTK